MTTFYLMIFLAATIVLGCSSQGGKPGAGTGGMGGAAGTACTDPLMIDDMEDGDRFICGSGSGSGSSGRTGDWYTISDGTSTNLSPSPTGDFTQTLIPGGRGTSRYAARMTGSGFTLWGNAMGFYLNGQTPAVRPYDASATHGVRFWLKSNVSVGVNFLLPETAAIGEPGGTCLDDTTAWNCDNDFYFEIAAPSSSDWVEYDVPYAAAEQPFFKPDANGNPIAGTATWRPSHLLGVQFNVSPGRTFDVSIDDIRFYACTSTDCVPTCTDATAPVVCPAKGGVPAHCWPTGTDCSQVRALSLNGVWGSGPSDVWAVGGQGPGFAGAIFHWNGAAWASATTTMPHALNGVWGSGANDVWAVGNNGTVVHWDGSTWSSPASGTAHPLRGIWGSSPTDVWAVGGAGSIIHWDGSSWSMIRSASALTLNGVWGSGASDVWAVGSSGAPGLFGATAIILHLNGSAWSPVTNAASFGLNGVWGSGPGDVWAVGGAAGINTMVHWNGSAWAAAPGGTPNFLSGVWGSGPNDVWAVGGVIRTRITPPGVGTAVRWNGSAWSVVPSGNNAVLNGVWGSDPNDVWAVGFLGEALHWDGSDWSSVPMVSGP